MYVYACMCMHVYACMCEYSGLRTFLTCDTCTFTCWHFCINIADRVCHTCMDSFRDSAKPDCTYIHTNTVSSWMESCFCPCFMTNTHTHTHTQMAETYIQSQCRAGWRAAFAHA